jgi:F0F1-type ATP synthase assembly protein I
MKKAAADPTTKSRHGASQADQFSVGTLGLDLLDTTWRIAVPVLICTALGIFADLQFDTKPWLTLVAVVVGFVVAGLLIKKLITAIEKEDK